MTTEPQALLKAKKEIRHAISSSSSTLIKETSWLVELPSECSHSGHVMGKVYTLLF